MGDQAAYRHAGKIVEEGKNYTPDRTAHILEIDVDAVRACGLQFLFHIWRAVIDGGVEAKLIDKVRGLLPAACDADNPAALDLRDLTNCGADWPSRCGNRKRLACLREPDISKPGIRRHPRHSENAKGGRNRGCGRVELPQTAAV